MSTHEHDSDHDLLARLRALPNERDVPADGWARLSARLPPRESQAAPAPTDNVVVLPVRSRRRWWWPAGAALAASLALYAVAPWRHAQPDTPAPSALQLQAAAMTEQYQQAVAALPDALKEPLLLCAMEGLAQDQAATILGISRKAVETRLYRARQKLSHLIEG